MSPRRAVANDAKRPGPAPAGTARGPLAAILDHLRAEPSRTWSIIVTLYGDAILPRGGSVWLGTLLAFFREIDIAEGVVRTAVSRLSADGWLTRRRVGRNSFYQLGGKGQAVFAAASARIYAPQPPAWAGYFDMVMLAPRADHEAARVVLEEAAFGCPAPGLWLAPAGTSHGDIEGLIRLRVEGDAAANRALAAQSWKLAETEAAYARFVAQFQPLYIALESGAALSDAEAMVARILLIHAYRRIVLRDPILPAEILPPGWSGEAARQLCARIYRFLLPGSERWLAAHARDENGAALPANPAVFARFAE